MIGNIHLVPKKKTVLLFNFVVMLETDSIFPICYFSYCLLGDNTNAWHCFLCLPRHLGDCLSHTPASWALLTRHTLNLSPFTKEKPGSQLNFAAELIFLPFVNLTDPSVGACISGQFKSGNMKHTSSEIIILVTTTTMAQFVVLIFFLI